MTEENAGEVRVLQRTGGTTLLEAKWEFPPKKHKTEYAKICSEIFIIIIIIIIFYSSTHEDFR